MSPNDLQSWNRYSYVLNNPLSFVDPYGLVPLEGTLLQFFNAFFGQDRLVSAVSAVQPG